MSNRKRSYPYSSTAATGVTKQRMVGGLPLSYRPSAPVAGSYRSRQSLAAAVRSVGEKKGMDTALTLSPVTDTTNTNASSFVLNLVQQGAGSWNRIGRKINLQSVRLRGVATFAFQVQAVTGQLFANTLRMVVVWDKQPSGAAIPTFDTIFGKTDQSGTESTTFLDPVRYDNMDRFVILRDVVKDAQSEATSDAGTTLVSQVNCSFDEYVKLGSREVVFSGQSNPMTIADISSGALYVYFRAETNSILTTQVSIDATSFARLRYTDI